MGSWLHVFCYLFVATAASAKIVFKDVDYTGAHGTPLQGWLAYDDAVAGPRPGILLIHDWRGLTDYIRTRSKMLAQLGYAVFAADIYGKGVHPKTIDECEQLSIFFYQGDRALYRGRARAGYDALLRAPQVDPKQIAPLGYCFGGTGVLEMLRDGVPLRGAISFQGNMSLRPFYSDAPITTKLLVFCGFQDPYVPPTEVLAFEKQWAEKKVDLQIISYSGIFHAFSDPGIDALHQPGAAYNALADRRSWQAMCSFLQEIFSGNPRS